MGGFDPRRWGQMGKSTRHYKRIANISSSFYLGNWPNGDQRGLTEEKKETRPGAASTMSGAACGEQWSQDGPTKWRVEPGTRAGMRRLAGPRQGGTFLRKTEGLLTVWASKKVQEGACRWKGNTNTSRSLHSWCAGREWWPCIYSVGRKLGRISTTSVILKDHTTQRGLRMVTWRMTKPLYTTGK